MNYPHGVYAAMNLSRETEENIKEYCSEHLPGMEMNDDLHCTLIYSKKPHEPRIKRIQDRKKGSFKGFAKYGDDKESLVIEISSDEMAQLHGEMTKEHDFISDYDSYSPHISLSYKGREVDIDDLPAMDFDIDMEHQVIEGLDEEDCGCDEEDSFDPMVIG